MQREEARQKGGTQMHNIANDGGFHHPKYQKVVLLTFDVDSMCVIFVDTSNLVQYLNDYFKFIHIM